MEIVSGVGGHAGHGHGGNMSNINMNINSFGLGIASASDGKHQVQAYRSNKHYSLIRLSLPYFPKNMLICILFLGDANTALAELDQGLRCGRLGEQSEAIVRFPRLFTKYPFPILINSALLKLADIFRQSSNFIKLCVLRVVQQSERHLDKITNVDEFVKRVSTVLHSNDPVARALTLR